jgi:GH15 family glucan-1,4-alpha-glucosidase
MTIVAKGPMIQIVQPRIEDYALIGDTQTAALVRRDCRIDWLCLPRFDSEACFAALLGRPEHGCWTLEPAAPIQTCSRCYLGETLILQSELVTEHGAVQVLDFMPPRGEAPDIVRIVVGLRGEVPMRMRLAPRFGYGAVTPWILPHDDGAALGAGPDALRLVTPASVRVVDGGVEAEFTVRANDRVPFVLTWYPSHKHEPRAVDPERALSDTRGYWTEWVGRCTYTGRYRDAVIRSLLTLKALTYKPTGGIVAAPTTSLPEKLGGVRNWDYRFAWLRDATLTLNALMSWVYDAVAAAWRAWLERAIAGAPAEMQILYGVAGERRIPECTLDWLPGFAGSKPVRLGNAAVEQFQLDVYGEVLDCLHQARRRGIAVSERAWELQRGLMEYVEQHWTEPDDGLWEVRGGRQQFTQSKVMAWVAADRAVSAIENFGLTGPLERWRALRERIHADVCERGYNARAGAFTQSYGSDALDASLLVLPLVGFLPHDDVRVRSTTRAIERDLMRDGFVLRYDSEKTADGLPEGEGAFLACTFWLADNYALAGRWNDAEAVFERLLALRNDVGLLAEEYDPHGRRQLGNFPQAFSHLALVNTALNLEARVGAAKGRRG